MRGTARLSGTGLGARAGRGTLAAVAQVGAGQVLRLVSNIALARLLFPEAFGMMAIALAVVTGLSMVSTFGLRASVVQSARGDDPAFLDTIWSLQALRGLALAAFVWMAAAPLARLYDVPMLAQILPVCGLGLLVAGLNPISVLSAERHMRLWRLTAVQLLAQLGSLIAMALLAWWLRSVWALAAGAVIQPVLALILLRRHLPGHRGRFAIEREGAREILRLGKYLFVSSIASYALLQSDRAILGAAIPLDLLGLYSISLALASLPGTAIKAISSRVLFPLMRERHPADGPRARARVFAARRAVAGAGLVGAALMALAGPGLIGLLYDARYAGAGGMVVLLAASAVPAIATGGMLHAVLVRGDSLRFMGANLALAAAQVAIMIPAALAWGIPGVALALFAAPVLAYPATSAALARHASWDWRGDLGLMALGLTLASSVCTLHWERLAPLAP